jgi:hypothetical protein
MEVLIQLYVTPSAVPFELEDEHSTPAVLPGIDLLLAEHKVHES